MAKTRSGSFEMIKYDGRSYCIAHHITVPSPQAARQIMAVLQGKGKFQTEYRLNEYWNGIEPDQGLVIARHFGVPRPDTLDRAQRLIRETVQQVPRSRYVGWERNEMDPEQPQQQYRPDDDDNDDDSPFAPVMPLKS
jgi:hypothetical protein